MSKAMTLGPVALMGHSMGGKTAMALALAYPDLVERLIVVDIAPRSYADTLSSYAQAMRSVDVFAAASRGEIQRQLQALLPDASVAPFLVQNLVHAQRTFRLAHQSGSDHRVHARPERFSGRTDAQTHFDRADAPPSPAPCRTMYPVAMPARSRRCSRTSHVEVIDGAAHWVHADQPQEFIESRAARAGALSCELASGLVAAACGRIRSARPVQQHRHRRVAHDLLGITAHQHPADAAPCHGCRSRSARLAIPSRPP